MGTTLRGALRYPTLLDAPNGPLALQQLAEDVDALLYRAFPCTSTTRPLAPPDGMLIRESDTGAVLIFGAQVWHHIGGAAFTPADAQYSANRAQSIPSGDPSRPVAFADADVESPIVERAARGGGHEFRLTVGGIWTITTSVRLDADATDGERRVEIFTGGSSAPLATAAHDGPVFCANLSITRRFPPGAVVYVAALHFTGETRTTDPGPGGSTCRVNLARVTT